MNAPSRKLRPGDEVELRLTGVVLPTGRVAVGRAKPQYGQESRDHDWLLSLPEDELVSDRGALVVTLLVDHPSRDLVGAVRGDDSNVWVKISRYGDDVEMWPIIGAVPNTPAAKLVTSRAAAEETP